MERSDIKSLDSCDSTVKKIVLFVVSEEIIHLTQSQKSLLSLMDQRPIIR